jgi:Zn-finger nucleic acid-binding protein
VLGLPPPAASTKPQAVTYVRCPDCESIMTRKNFARRSGTVIDLCSAHGVWFDRDELARIIEFVRTGGLDAARRREVEDLKEEARAAAAKRASEEIRASLGPADADPFFRRGSTDTLLGILGALFR